MKNYIDPKKDSGMVELIEYSQTMKAILFALVFGFIITTLIIIVFYGIL